MASSSLPDRVNARPVARAMTSPLGVGLAAVGAALTLLTGAGVVAAVVVAVVVWAARVAVAIPRGERRERIDPFTLGDPWRQAVKDALQARARFEEVVHATRQGPLRERMEEIGRRISHGVEDVWAVARRGQALVEARRRIDVDAVRRELDRTGDAAPDAAAGVGGLSEALQSQLAAAERLDATITRTRERLRLTNVRLDEAAARAAELSVAAHDAAQLELLGGDVEAIVGDLEALRLGLEEVQGPGAP
jgi:hypothetical protein